MEIFFCSQVITTCFPPKVFKFRWNLKVPYKLPHSIRGMERCGCICRIFCFSAIHRQMIPRFHRINALRIVVPYLKICFSCVGKRNAKNRVCLLFGHQGSDLCFLPLHSPLINQLAHIGDRAVRWSSSVHLEILPIRDPFVIPKIVSLCHSKLATLPPSTEAPFLESN